MKFFQALFFFLGIISISYSQSDEPLGEMYCGNGAIFFDSQQFTYDQSDLGAACESQSNNSGWYTLRADENEISILAVSDFCNNLIGFDMCMFDSDFNKIGGMSWVGSLNRVARYGASVTPGERYHLLLKGEKLFDCIPRIEVRGVELSPPQVVSDIQYSKRNPSCKGETVHYWVENYGAHFLSWSVPHFATIVENHFDSILVQYDTVGLEASIELEVFGPCRYTTSLTTSLGTPQTLYRCPFDFPFDVLGGEIRGYGTHVTSIPSSSGCDSLFIWDIQREFWVQNLNKKICPGQVFEFEGLSFAGETSQRYYREARNLMECDTLFNINVQFAEQNDPPNVLQFENRFICEGDSIEYGGVYFSESGQYEFHFPNEVDTYCDSTFRLWLTTLDYEKPLNLQCTFLDNPSRLYFDWDEPKHIYRYEISINGEPKGQTATSDYSYFLKQSNEEVTIQVQPIPESVIECQHAFEEYTCIGPEFTSSLEKQNDKSLVIAPNPSNGIFQIQTEASIDFVEVIDLKGKVIANGNSQQIDLSAFPNGVYFFRVKNGKSVSIAKGLKIN